MTKELWEESHRFIKDKLQEFDFAYLQSRHAATKKYSREKESEANRLRIDIKNYILRNDGLLMLLKGDRDEYGWAMTRDDIWDIYRFSASMGTLLNDIERKMEKM